jgi:2-amino-4-hydroxy-6-hydroxymethyldihydropteridine diphosphokinase
MAEREFVMRPLADILPQWQHPHTGRTATDMLADLPEQEAVRIEATLL